MGLTFGLAVLVTDSVDAADHLDAPAGGIEDRPVDIGDLYAWHTDAGNLVMIVTFSGYANPAVPPQFDPDVLYAFHVDTSGDAVADFDVLARFGQNAAGDWGVRFEGIPGEAAALEGPVEDVLMGDGGAMAYAGVHDDPFFFDLDGFRETVMTGTLSFMASRDFAAAQNTAALVVEVPLAALGASGAINVWATSGRK